jgi:predicted neutral ceramidase superfamily lipid hydrolase
MVCLDAPTQSFVVLTDVDIVFNSGQSGETGPGNSKWTKLVRFALHFFRFPIFIAIILTVVGGSINMHSLGDAGSIVLVVTFAYVCGLVTWLALKSRSMLPASGHRAVLLTVLTLPFLLIRVIYFLLLEYGPPKFNPATGEVGILIGMGLLMEIIVVVFLSVARAVAEPVWPLMISKRIAYDDLESPVN